MRRCDYCGAEVSSGARFCGRCGRALVGLSQAQQPPPPTGVPEGSGTPSDVTPTTRPPEGRPFAIASLIIGAIAFPTQMFLGACCSWIVWPLVAAGVILGIVAIAMRDAALGAAGIGINLLATIIQIMALSGVISGISRSMQW